jgi:heterodisulfide reductase subunit A
MVIGGGIAGIQASLDLADMGVKVHLVERQPGMGGHMAQLDKTFPTNDCAICILAPKMADCFGHPNIDVMTYSEVKSVDGEAGAFSIVVTKKARYVKDEECTGCGECVERCPTRIPDELMTIDSSNCLKLTRDRCGICQRVCDKDAIDYEQQDQDIQLDVGAIILATGFSLVDALPLQRYGYSKIQNVITSLEYERLICASGPTGGHLERPSDHRTAKRLAFIQCVGSRDTRRNRYCSSVCCMHSTKEAILASEHEPGTQSFIFYTDLRAAGKGFQEYTKRAQEEYGVTYIKGRIGEINENWSGDPVVWYEDTEADEVKQMTVDLAILASSLTPVRGSTELAELLNIELDEYGFFRTDPYFPVETTRKGIFACGYCRDPMDIPESVTSASSAASSAASIALGAEEPAVV